MESCAPPQIGQGKVDTAIAAVGGAQQRKQRLVPLNL